MTYSYKTKGTCSTQIDLELDGNIVHNVKFTGRLQRQPAGNPKISGRPYRGIRWKKKSAASAVADVLLPAATSLQKRAVKH